MSDDSGCDLTLNIAVYMIDGWGKPPNAWYTLGRQIAVALGKAGLRWLDRLDPELIRDMRAEKNAGTRIIAIGHSLGGERIEQLAADHIYPDVAVLIDAVRSNWERRPFVVQATHAISFTRRWFWGAPPSMGLRDKDVKVIATHNGIIAKISPSVVSWVESLKEGDAKFSGV